MINCTNQSLSDQLSALQRERTKFKLSLRMCAD